LHATQKTPKILSLGVNHAHLALLVSRNQPLAAALRIGSVLVGLLNDSSSLSAHIRCLDLTPPVISFDSKYSHSIKTSIFTERVPASTLHYQPGQLKAEDAQAVTVVPALSDHTSKINMSKLS
jgi:hypothetical protein